MPESWKLPVARPLFTDCLIQEIEDEARNAPDKEKAFDTRFRFSDSGDCARSLAYKDLGLPNPLDAASLLVAFIGTTYHELLQAAIQRRYPGAEVELQGIVPEASDSGHCDALVTLEDGTRVLYELKTKSIYQFDKATGINRKANKWYPGGPEGPGIEVILQGGMNCLAHNCDVLVVGYVCFQNYTPYLFDRLDAGLSCRDQFRAEWSIPRDVWEPLVKREIERLNEISESVDLGYLPAREVYNEKDFGELKEIDPEDTSGNKYWKCRYYCRFFPQCCDDGPGTVEIPVEIRKTVPA